MKEEKLKYYQKLDSINRECNKEMIRLTFDTAFKSFFSRNPDFLKDFLIEENRVINLTNALFSKIQNDEDFFYYDSSELNEIFSQLTEIAMEYPNDLDKSLFYVFNYPFPSGAIPAERKLLEESNLNYVICFGEIDWMDQCGSRRLEEKCPQRFKVYTISKKGHRFALENPKETFDVILQNF